MNRISKILVLGLVPLLFFIVTGNGVGAEVGVTDDSVLVGCSNSFSGPLVYPGTQLVNNGLESYFGYVNAMGGVNGRKILSQYYDDGYKPQNAVANTKRLVEQDKVFAIVSSQGTGAVISRKANEVERQIGVEINGISEAAQRVVAGMIVASKI